MYERRDIEEGSRSMYMFGLLIILCSLSLFWFAVGIGIGILIS